MVEGRIRCNSYAARRLKLEKLLKSAIANAELQLVRRTAVETGRGHFLGAEAGALQLVRRTAVETAWQNQRTSSQAGCNSYAARRLKLYQMSLNL